MSALRRRSLSLSLVAWIVPLAAAGPALAESRSLAEKAAESAGRNFDLRRVVAPAVRPDPGPDAARALARWRSERPSLIHDVDERTGAIRTLVDPAGPLSDARSGDAEQIAVDFAAESLDLLGLTASDLDDFELTDRVESRASGVTHVYLRQRFEGRPVYNGQLHVNVAEDGRVLSVNNLFVPRLASAVNAVEPEIDADAALAAFERHLGIGGLPELPGQGRLMYLPIRPGEVRLVWNFAVDLAAESHWYDVTVDAVDGRVWTRFDWVADADYKVYEFPVEHPGFTTPAPPADARTVATNPQDPTASPFGWHDLNGAPGAETTLTSGNNVNACTDVDANNTCDPGSQPDGGAGLSFQPALDLTQPPSSNRPAAVVNLYYWNNIIHDIEYQYGFDEAAGNFQENNYGNGGAGSDSVNADAQDGSGTCNANFGTPADGGNPRMQMFISSSSCWSGSPARDGDLDNMVIVHEYGHGISNRLVGGPGNVSCLNNTEQPGEGTSDWWGLSLTATAAQNGPDVRGVGTWLFGNLFPQGIRPFPYSTDDGVNPHTYNSIAGPVSVPHGVGAVWAQGYWEAYWALVDEHGFDPDFYAFTGTAGDAGNIRAKYYLIEGLKNTVCSPGFVDVRNGILTAAAAPPYNGADTCVLWEAFAGFGLGFSADQGSSNSRTDQTEAFDVPTFCSLVGGPPDLSVCAGNSVADDVTVGAAFTPPVTMSASGNPAGSNVTFNPNPVPGPLPTTTLMTVSTTGATPPGTYTVTVTGDDGVTSGSDTFDLVVDTTPATATTLLTPPNGATGVSTSAPLGWTAVAGATSYDVEVDDDSNFSSPEFTANVPGNSTTATGLAIDTTYFWRVRALNGCGGTFSAPFSFTTELVYCSTPGLAIPDNNPTGVTDTLVIPDDGSTITDLDLSLLVSHTWVGDLSFTLTHVDSGTTIVPFDRPGVPASTFGCSGNDIDATLDDEAGSPVETQCAAGTPTINGTFSPNVALSAFDTELIGGTWTLRGVDHAGGDTGTLQEWCLVPALLTPVEHTLDVSVVGSGTVTSSPAGINCPGDCTEDYLENTPVTLTATPDAGWTFAGWSGDCSGTGTCDLTMSADRTATATFVEITWTLDVTVAGPGSVTSSPAGISCPGDCTETYVDGTPVDLTATPGPDAHLVGWSGACSGTGACSVTMTADQAVTATFDTMPFLDGFESGDTSAWSSSVP